jgi:hypothetical protein
MEQAAIIRLCFGISKRLSGALADLWGNKRILSEQHLLIEN